MTSTMLPPPAEEETRTTSTEPPERSRDSTLPPADLGPMGLALRLLALEAKVDDIHAETFGISKAYHDMRNAIVGINDSLDRLATSLEVLDNDATGQRLDRASVRDDLDKLAKRVTGIERKKQ